MNDKIQNKTTESVVYLVNARNEQLETSIDINGPSYKE